MSFRVLRALIPALLVTLVLAALLALVDQRGTARSSASDFGYYNAVSPARIVDTRTSVGGHPFKLGEGETATFDVTGVGGVPASGVTAVALNVTATEGTFYSYLTVYPSGASRPNASDLNFVPGQDVANIVIVKVGADGNVSVYNYGGQVHVVFDVVGWFGSSGSTYSPLTPARIVDTRTTVGGHAYKLAQGEVASFQVADVGGVPASGAAAVALNVTASQGNFPSYLTVYPSYVSRPNASNLNFLPNQDIPNMVIVKVGPEGSVDVYNYGGEVHVIFDVVGWFGSAGGTFVPLAPARVVDTRNGAGGHPYKVGEGEVATFDVTGVGGVPASGVTAVALNVTVTGADFPSYLTVYPSGASRPNASNLNFLPSQDVPNMVLVKVGPDGNVNVYNYGGHVHVVFDVAGYFTTTGATPAPTPVPTPVPTPPPTPVPTPSPGGYIVVSSCIDGTFTGWTGDTVFELCNGQLWRQASYAYTYHYAYRPDVLIFDNGYEYRMKVEGVDEVLPVVKVTGFMKTCIDGTFEGWSGDTVFTLCNGQVWQQTTYAYTYHYAYRPDVLIYWNGYQYKMKVEGVDQTIAVVRIL